MLSDARAEVAVLTAHRDEISKQLGDLSGVIEALAVIERPESAVDDGLPDSGLPRVGLPSDGLPSTTPTESDEVSTQS
jgi:hypothetical protein